MRDARYRLSPLYLGYLAVSAILTPLLTALWIGPILHLTSGLGLSLTAGIGLILGAFILLPLQLLCGAILHPWNRPIALGWVLALFLGAFPIVATIGGLLLEDGWLGFFATLLILVPNIITCVILAVVALRRGSELPGAGA